MSKRTNREGTIVKRSDGRWTAALSLDGGKRKFFYGKTQQEVKDKLRAARRALDDGLPVSSDRQKVGHYLERWLQEVAEPTVRQSTYTRYRELLTLHVMPTLGHLPLVKLGPQDLNGLYGKLRRHLKPRTVGHVHRCLHRALRDALLWGLVSRNACDTVKPPKVPHQEMQVLDADQARALLNAATESRLEALFVVALTAGLREGELLALKWGDFHADSGRLTVCRAVRQVAGQGPTVSEPKTARSRRGITLAPMAVSALKAHRTQQAKQRLAAVFWEENDLIFANSVGRHITPQNLVNRAFRPLLEKAGLPRIRFHDLRHSAATLPGFQV